MKILILTHNTAFLGGSYMRAFALARSLVTLGHEVTLIASPRNRLARKKRQVIDGVCVMQMTGILGERLRDGGLDPLDLAMRLVHIIGHGYDLVYGFDHRPVVSFPALLFRISGKGPYLADWADLWGRKGIADEREHLSGKLLGFFDHHWERFTRKHADALTVISTFMLEQAVSWGVARERITLVPAGASSDQIASHDRDEMRRRYGIPPDIPVLVHIGFAPYDVTLLADTFIRIVQSDPGVRLIMIGGELPLFRQKITSAGIAGSVVFMGVVPFESLGERMSCGDLMLLPFSDQPLNRARFPNRFGDYLAAGRPIATNDTGDIAVIVKRENIGIVAPDQPDEFAAAISSLLKAPAEMRLAMGRRARILSEGPFSWEAMAEKADAAIQGVMARRSS